MEVKVWVDEKFRKDLIEEYNFNQHFSYRIFNNVIVEVDEKEIIIYSNDNTLAKLYPHFKFKETTEIKLKEQNTIKEAVLIHASFKDVYFHWIYDIIPQLKVLESNSNLKIIMCPLKNSFQLESFKLFCNIKDVYTKSSFYEIDKLYLPSQTTNLLMPCNFVFEFLTANLIKTKTNKIKNKIYITRDKKYKRSILNEKELIHIMEAKGYLIYNLEYISFSEQVEIFRNSNVIISAHGSGLTNIVFCEPGTTILEIYGPGCGERCFARIGNHLMLNYIALEISEISYQSFLHRLYYMFFPNLNRFDFRVAIKTLDRNLPNYLS
jgi:hypothetical protein